LLRVYINKRNQMDNKFQFRLLNRQPLGLNNGRKAPNYHFDGLKRRSFLSLLRLRDPTIEHHEFAFRDLLFEKLSKETYVGQHFVLL
jgi:hypothetical protein